MNWNEILDESVPWQQCYPKVGEAVKQFLSNYPDSEFTTRSLVLGILDFDCPAKIRARFFSALKSEASGLQGWYKLGPAVRGRGPLANNMIRPKLWQMPQSKETITKETCPLCGR